MDGVLVDSTPAVARVWTIWANKFGFDPGEVVRRAHGRPSIATIRELLPDGDHRAEDQESNKPKSKMSGISSLCPVQLDFSALSPTPGTRWSLRPPTPWP